MAIDFSHIDEDTVYTLKISNGDELISRLAISISGKLALKDPLLIMVTQQGIQFAPAVFSGDKTKPVDINADSVMMLVPAEDNAVAAYRKATTGIEVPQKQIITG